MHFKFLKICTVKGLEISHGHPEQDYIQNVSKPLKENIHLFKLCGHEDTFNLLQYHVS